MAAQNAALAQSLGLLDSEGEWDVTKLHNVAKDAIKKSGSFPFMGIIVRDEDIEKLFVYINKMTTGGGQ